MTIRNIVIFCLTLGILLLTSVSVLQAQGPEPLPPEVSGKIDPRLVKRLITSENVTANIIVVMKDKADLTTAKTRHSPLARRRAIVSGLQATAKQSQAGVLALLGDAARRREASDIRSLWIVNSVAANASWPVVLALAARDDVAMVRLEEIISLPPQEEAAAVKTTVDVEWGIARINAPDVWHALRIDGSGVVVANLDSGVDYLHPDLRTRYRGYNGENALYLHEGNWYDATGQGALYPTDANGHGTHTMGTLVGGNGIGVAPGAKWIAVRAFDSSGSAPESWLHDAFQWLLAPGGNPALAPQVVNNSWGTNSGGVTVYEEDVQHLLDAGIIPIFSAGNGGPAGQTVGAPASYEISLAVGAIDSDDDIANFSSRGPSPWEKIKPELSAPGVDVLSALPGGGYKRLNGTSMAAPHVSGVVALMLQADPALTYAEAIELLTTTATPLGDPIPNNRYGWGLVNAYNAVGAATNAGTITGTVTNQAGAEPIAGATITFTPRGLGQTTGTSTDIDGHYQWAGTAGSYDLALAAFGYTPKIRAGIDVVTGTSTLQDFALVPLPTGTLKGTVTETGTGLSLSATITIEGTPLTAITNPGNGAYNISLPAGTYTMTVAGPGHRVAVVANLPISTGQATVQDVVLKTAPTILLVDSGLWYFRSQISHYQQALDALGYYYDNHRIKQIPENTPISSTLTAYDIVIWSAPFDAPGLIGAGQALQDFLDQGGQLFLSGQDVAFFDGGGTFSPSLYYFNYLKSLFGADNAGTDTVDAVAGEIFSGLEITISGGDGAGNQLTPDVIRTLNPDATNQILAYNTKDAAGYRVGHCLPYRAINLPFGLEGVSRHMTRVQILERSLDWFQSGPVSDAFEATPSGGTEAGDFGGNVTHTFRLRNLAEIGADDTYTFSLSSHKWTTNFSYSDITLGPCQSAWLTFSVEVPPDANWNDQETLTITVQSSQAPGLQSVITRTSKAPAPILLVDDDRWYDFEDQFMASLTANSFTFDYWDVGGGNPEGGPSLDVLQRYPLVIWFNGYDWFNPITGDEENRLQSYLDGGGRLILTSQEYLFKLPDHAPSPFAQDYLGVYTHSEILSSTLATGVAGNPVGDQLGPYDLTFPFGYKNWTDSITPTATASAAMRSQDGIANAVTHMGGLTETWHTAFFAFGLELLDDPDLTELMRRIVGWLSWLGNSTVSAGAEAVADNDLITYTALLKNDGLENITTATFTATFPPPLNLIPGSATGGLTESNGNLIWSGPLAKNQAITFTYQAVVSDNVPYGTMSRQISWLGYQDHGITFDRVVALPVNTAEWSRVTLDVTPSQAGKNEVLTYTLYLTNTGLADAPLVTVTNNIPPYLQVITPTIGQGGGTLNLAQLENGTITWLTPVAVNQGVTLTYAAQLIAIPYPFTLSNTFTADDGFLDTYRWSVEFAVIPYLAHLPIIFKD